MTVINTFLQKIKLREFNHGYYMVFAAYVLSFLLLVIGSDTFYNIKSKADGMNIQSDEVNQLTLPIENEGALNTHLLEQQHQQYVSTSNDTNWLLGYSMNEDEYVRLMSRMNESEVFLEDSEKTIMSLSTLELDTYDFSDNSTKESLPKDSLPTEASSDAIVATKDDVKILEQIVEAEATGEDMKGKILVANVIFNRMVDEEFPDNVKDVVFQKVGGEYQFSPISDKRFWSVKVTDDTREAVQRAINGEDYSEGALYFMARRLARKSSAKWFDNNLKWLLKHGEHEFFK